MPNNITQEKKRLLEIVAAKNLRKLKKSHDRFLDRYYDYKQTEFKDGPAARYRKDSEDSDDDQSSQEQEPALSPRTDLVQ